MKKNKQDLLDIQMADKTRYLSSRICGSMALMPQQLKEYYKNYEPLTLSNVCCENCMNFAGKCEWSKSFNPVPGWYAKEITKQTDHGDEKFYKILFCPKFESDASSTGSDIV